MWSCQLNERVLPWNAKLSPYQIWLREIILQQTRLEQGWPFYEKIVKNYPTVHHLAKANEADVFKLWEGLGYYNRCRNMLASAKIISKELNGIIPDTYQDLIKLKGIGDYTASAILSFAYDKPYAVLDGNVHRVLSRFFGLLITLDSKQNIVIFKSLAKKAMGKSKSAQYNQAIMDFGATHCKAQQALCLSCILKKNCFAFLNNEVENLPPPRKKLELKKRYFHYALIRKNDKILISQRLEKDIWFSLFQLPMIEQEDKPKIFNNAKRLFSVEQKLSHQHIHSIFYEKTFEKKMELKEGEKWISISDIKKYAFPKSILTFYKKMKYI